MTNIEFHTHTVYSHDAFTTIKQLEFFFSRNPKFVIAITDHNEIEGALRAAKKFADRIIVGEEIKTRHGEIIGLYLSEFIEPGKSLERTIEYIRMQGGLVMVPHPFKRHGKSDSPLSEELLYSFIDHFDMIEIFNSRNRTRGANRQAMQFAEKFNKLKVVGSDAHAVYELGRTFVSIQEYSGKDNLLDQLPKARLKCQSIKFSHRLMTRIQRELRRFN